MQKSINIKDYSYGLPEDRIALFPPNRRDQSKLLVYTRGRISHNYFNSLAEFIPSNSILFFNDTKVIPARLHFMKSTGAEIEIFILNPITPSPLLAVAMQTTGKCSWKCTIGNLKRWNEGVALEKNLGETILQARLLDREEGVVEFTWTTSQSFAELINQSGDTPLPPYLKRKAETTDKQRYQTIYAHYEGAVAAPTAGLHFTPQIIDALKAKGIVTDFITLHVSAGTFQPVKVQNATEHTMHKEQVLISKANLENLLRENKFIVPVGTTSMRTLESVYWFGVKLLQNPQSTFTISQNDPYEFNGEMPSKGEALNRVLNYMHDEGIETLTGETSIYIMPGYTFKVCEGLITNFHQPGSTLILLVAAFIGNDWKRVYDEALNNSYRFLSYGDSSLLIP